MVRSSKPDRNKLKLKEERESLFKYAILQINEGKMNSSTASKLFKLPKSTLNDRISGKSTGIRGAPPVLSTATESTLPL